jgi:hypothetical protein
VTEPLDGYTTLYLSPQHYAYGCVGCGVLVVEPHTHDNWCPAKEHQRKMADYAKVFKWKEGAGE